jgi:hypothetical protein
MPDDMGYAPPGYSYVGNGGYGELKPYIKYGESSCVLRHSACCNTAPACM